MLEYPIVTENGETFLTQAQLSRFVRDKCGETVGLYLEEAISCLMGMKAYKRKIGQAMKILDSIDLTDAICEIEEAQRLLNDT